MARRGTSISIKQIAIIARRKSSVLAIATSLHAHVRVLSSSSSALVAALCGTCRGAAIAVYQVPIIACVPSTIAAVSTRFKAVGNRVWSSLVTDEAHFKQATIVATVRNSVVPIVTLPVVIVARVPTLLLTHIGVRFCAAVAHKARLDAADSVTPVSAVRVAVIAVHLPEFPAIALRVVNVRIIVPEAVATVFVAVVWCHIISAVAVEAILYRAVLAAAVFYVVVAFVASVAPNVDCISTELFASIRNILRAKPAIVPSLNLAGSRATVSGHRVRILTFTRSEVVSIAAGFCASVCSSGRTS